MAQIKTAELEGAALDWAVAKCEGEVDADILCGAAPCKAVMFDVDGRCMYSMRHGKEFRPSTNWAQGGLIIEREGIAIDCVRCDGHIVNWLAARPPMDDELIEWDGLTPLIAAMRCYVASKLGDVVEVPDELVKA